MKYFSYYISLLLFINVSCIPHKYDDRQLTVSNLSQKSIYALISPNDDVMGNQPYSLIRKAKDSSELTKFGYEFDLIKPDLKVTVRERPTFWDDFFKDSDDKKIRIFIIEEDSVKKYGWIKIYKNQIFNKKYIYSIGDVERQNWEVTYPE